MNWMTWSLIGTGVWLLAKKPEGAVLIPAAPGPAPTPPAPAPTRSDLVPAAPPKPTLSPVTKTVTINGHNYTITRAGNGVFQVQSIDHPKAFIDFDQNGILSQGGTNAQIAEMNVDIHQIPAGLFTT